MQSTQKEKAGVPAFSDRLLLFGLLLVLLFGLLVVRRLGDRAERCGGEHGGENDGDQFVHRVPLCDGSGLLKRPVMSQSMSNNARVFGRLTHLVMAAKHMLDHLVTLLS